jgi:hypothetical protein
VIAYVLWILQRRTGESDAVIEDIGHVLESLCHAMLLMLFIVIAKVRPKHYTAPDGDRPVLRSSRRQGWHITRSRLSASEKRGLLLAPALLFAALVFFSFESESYFYLCLAVRISTHPQLSEFLLLFPDLLRVRSGFSSWSRNSSVT